MKVLTCFSVCMCESMTIIYVLSQLDNFIIVYNYLHVEIVHDDKVVVSTRLAVACVSMYQISSDVCQHVHHHDLTVQAHVPITAHYDKAHFSPMMVGQFCNIQSHLNMIISFIQSHLLDSLFRDHQYIVTLLECGALT